MFKEKNFVSSGSNWKTSLKEKKFLAEFILTLLVLIIILVAYSHFLNFAETRNGQQLNDPILNLFNPVDLTWLIFALVYFGIFLFLILLINHPKKIILAFQAYIILIIIRIFAMYLIPLNPPKNIIPLIDPVVENFGTGRLLTKDLFFSGHTATLFLFSLLIENKFFKILFLIFAIAAAAALMLQHVHYTIDIIFAFLFAYLVYKFTPYFINFLKRTKV